ncbi:MAG TPA: hypothetical protein PKD49_03620 [Hyphomicrobium sp.]|nr:hypothetical protein [Hyphomicrobium sp.]
MNVFRLLPLALAGSLLVPADAARAETLSGTWSGSGYVLPKDGQRESVRCRVTYTPQGEKVVAVVAACASASVTIRQTGSLSKVSDSRYIGDFHNPEYDISGRVRVTVSGGTQKVTFSSVRGGGSMTLRRR